MTPADWDRVPRRDSCAEQGEAAHRSDRSEMNSKYTVSTNYTGAGRRVTFGRRRAREGVMRIEDIEYTVDGSRLVGPLPIDNAKSVPDQECRTRFWGRHNTEP
jgi:hypothetical protein